MTELLTPQDLAPMLAEIIAANPDEVNPTNGSTCLYSVDLPDGTTRNCIVGKLAAIKGWPKTGPDEMQTAETVVRFYDWPITYEGSVYLTSVQIAADGMDPDTGQASPIPWGQIDPYAILALT